MAGAGAKITPQELMAALRIHAAIPPREQPGTEVLDTWLAGLSDSDGQTLLRLAELVGDLQMGSPGAWRKHHEKMRELRETEPPPVPRELLAKAPKKLADGLRVLYDLARTGVAMRKAAPKVYGLVRDAATYLRRFENEDLRVRVLASVPTDCA